MSLNREEVLTVLVAALKEDQEAVSAEPVVLAEDSRPLECLGDFDSLASVAVTQRCLDRLGIESKEITIFADKGKDGKFFARTLGQVADHILSLQ